MQTDQKLTERDRPVIERGLNLLDNILDGREQVNSGKLQNNAIISVNAYANLMIAISYSKIKMFEDIDVFLKEIKNELTGILTSNRVISNNLLRSKQFLKILKSFYVSNISEYLYMKREEKEWQDWLIQTL